MRQTTAKQNVEEVAFRQFNVPGGGGAGERADVMQKLAPALRAQVEEKKLDEVYETIDLPLAGVLAEMERTGVRVDQEVLAAISLSMEREVRRLEKEI